MDYPNELRFAEESLKQAEREFLDGNDGVAQAILVKLSTGTFSSDAKTSRERMQNLDESHYVKWNRWDQKYGFSASFWKNEGYPSIDATTHHARNPNWYSIRTGTTTFVKDLMVLRSVLTPTVDGEKNGLPTSPGNPANKWLLDYVVLSNLRLFFKNHWEQLVRDIVRKRSQTNLILVSERLGLTITEVISIVNKIKRMGDRVIERDASDPSKNMTYHCRKPDSSLTPPIDINT